MLTWTRRNNKYGPPTEVGKLGAIQIATVDWAMSSSKNEDEKIVWHHSLPGMKISEGRCKTEAEGKEKVEASVMAWLKHAGLQG